MGIRITAEIRRYTRKAFLLQGPGEIQMWVPRAVLGDIERTHLPMRTITDAGLTATVRTWYAQKHPEITALATLKPGNQEITEATSRYEADLLTDALETAAALVAAAADDPDRGARFRAWRSAGYLLEEPDPMRPDISYPELAWAFFDGANNVPTPPIGQGMLRKKARTPEAPVGRRVQRCR